MSIDQKARAYRMAAEAAEIDFEAAISGLVSGLEARALRAEEKANQARFALTCALAITAKGSRIGGGTSEAMLSHIVSAIGNPSCGAEVEFMKVNGEPK